MAKIIDFPVNPNEISVVERRDMAEKAERILDTPEMLDLLNYLLEHNIQSFASGSMDINKFYVNIEIEAMEDEACN